LDAANLRDESARARDLAASARDQSAVVRDLLMAARDEGDEGFDNARAITGAEIVIRAAATRRRAAERRALAAEHRALAAADREAAASERVLAAQERDAARAEREELTRQLRVAETDAVTGARSRTAGLRDLDYELVRCHRTRTALVVAYVDVVGLKALNDARGHAAGDALLAQAVALICSHLRPYDLVIRLGGDEFLCAMSQMTLADARERLGQVAAMLEAADDPGAIRTGFAELQADDNATALIARADDELTQAHQRARS